MNSNNMEFQRLVIILGKMFPKINNFGDTTLLCANECESAMTLNL